MSSHAAGVGEQDREHRYLIIAGTYKAGTTSLFTYLAHHPGVCASEQKETWFFSPRHLHYNDVPRYPEGLAPYLASFAKGRPDGLRVEGTPFYFYSGESAEWIHQALPDSKIVVVLGDPVWRMRSWYQMSVLYRWLDPDPGFDAYLKSLREDPRPPEQRPPHLRVLEHGRYAPYLKEYFRVFGRERVQVLWFDELVHHPLTAMRRLCRFAGLDPAFYTDYQFEIHLKALELKRERLFLAYIHLKNWLGRHLPHVQSFRKRLRKLRETLDRRVFPYMFKDAEKFLIPVAAERFLREYYAADAEELRELLGEPVPWLRLPEPPAESAGAKNSAVVQN
jgi:hypothetical protein